MPDTRDDQPEIQPLKTFDPTIPASDQPDTLPHQPTGSDQNAASEAAAMRQGQFPGETPNPNTTQEVSKTAGQEQNPESRPVNVTRNDPTQNPAMDDADADPEYQASDQDKADVAPELEGVGVPHAVPAGGPVPSRPYTEEGSPNINVARNPAVVLPAEEQLRQMRKAVVDGNNASIAEAKGRREEDGEAVTDDSHETDERDEIKNLGTATVGETTAASGVQPD